jgi:aminoglycoside 6'-N-acetyltransferase I
MGLALWPDDEREQLRSVFEELLRTKKEEPFICRDAAGAAVGFINMSTRTDYVEGTESSPVGYIEGIFVKEAFRGRGVGRALVRFADHWTKQKGYRQLASDAELDNVDSHHFHAAVGFRESGRIVTYVKDVGEGAD